VIVERGKEGDSQTAVRHGVQKTVACSRQKQYIHNGAVERGQGLPEPYERHNARQEGGEYQRMCESRWPQKSP